jgi:hypothetical protein
MGGNTLSKLNPPIPNRKTLRSGGYRKPYRIAKVERNNPQGIDLQPMVRRVAWL